VFNDAQVSLSAVSPTYDVSGPASKLSYSGPAVDTGSSKPPSIHASIRDILAVAQTEHGYILNPYGPQSVLKLADVWSSRFVGTSPSGPNYWLPQGLGVITEERYKFSLYEGEFESGFRQGFGKAPIFLPSGTGMVVFLGTYRGQWDHGHRHGFGELVDQVAGTTFFGEWRFDCKHGRGEEVYADGSRYVGLWASGQRHGPGRLYLAEGGVDARDYHQGRVIPLAHPGKVGEDNAVQKWLVEAKQKLAQAMEEQEAAVPTTTASLSGVSGKAGLADRRNLNQFKEKDIPAFAQHLSALAGGPVQLVVDTDSFLSGPQSKVSVSLLTDGQSQFLLSPLLKGIACVCEDASGKETFRNSVSKLTVKHDGSVREVSYKLVNKEWTISGNFEDPSEVIMPNKVTAWLEANI